MAEEIATAPAGATYDDRVARQFALLTIVGGVGGIVEILPLHLAGAITKPAPGFVPLGALPLEGRDGCVREGCYNSHSQMIRPLRRETERYGHFAAVAVSAFLWVVDNDQFEDLDHMADGALDDAPPTTELGP